MENLGREGKLATDNKMSLVHIAGYVTRKDIGLNKAELLDSTTFYYQKYGQFTDTLDRGWLNVPTDSAFQWDFLDTFCSIL